MTGCFNILGAKLLVGERLELVEGAALVVEDGRILSIGEPKPGVGNVDLSSKLLCPMFVNAHCHLGDTGLKELGLDLQMEEVLNPPDGLKHKELQKFSKAKLIQFMRHGLVEMLYNGIIACADFREQGLDGVRMLRMAAEGLPIQVIILGRMAEGASKAETLKEANLILAEANGLGIRDVESYPAEVLYQLRQEYPEKIFACHVSERREAETDSFVKTGLGQTAQALKWAPDILVHLVHTPASELRTAGAKGVFAVSCPRSNGVLGDGLPNLAEWRRQGLTFCLGTDNVMFCAPNMLREMEMASRLTRGLEESPVAVSALEILKSATINGARALGLDREVGSLSAGKQASFIVFNLDSRNLKYSKDLINAIVHRADTADIHAIYVMGKPLENFCLEN